MRKHKQIKYNTNIIKFKQYAILFIFFNFF